MMTLESNLRSVRNRITAAAGRVGRDPRDILLVAVTKSQPVEVVRAAYELGLKCFGENRVGEAEAKVRALPVAEWHMIGHIQSRKAKQVVSLFQYVHSVDSVELAMRLDRLWAGRPEPLPILLECNVSGEASKYGLPAAGWAHDQAQRQAIFEAVARILALPHLSVEGLMTVAPIATSAEDVRPTFVSLRQLRDALRDRFPHRCWRHLSMGMTDDFEVAIEEGATMVRIGRAIFAPDQPALCAVGLSASGADGITSSV